MTFRLSRQQYRQLVDWAHEAGNEECCGLILDDGAGMKLCLAPNVAAEPRAHFEIDPRLLIDAERAARAGEAVIRGYFHSHPNGLSRPSVEDAAMAAVDGRYWLIIAGENVSAWQKRDDTGFVEVPLVIEG